MKIFFKNRKLNIFLKWLVLLLLLAVLAFTLWQIAFSFESLKQAGDFRQLHPRRLSAGPRISPEQIRGWMTFRYIDLAFNLPSGYLRGALNITDKRYPNLSIDALARAQKTDARLLLQKVIAAVNNFSNSPAQ